MALFNKILIANRGEIAARIIRTAARLGIQTVAVHTMEDIEALHVHLATESMLLRGDNLASTYLDVDQIVEKALAAGAEAIHPGYGFLSENPALAESCEKKGLVFIGPSPDMIRLMGNKLSAAGFVKELGIPVLDMMTGNPGSLIESRHSIRYPVLVKAAAGGGGKGMRIVRRAADLEQAVSSTAREAMTYFGNDEVYVEKYIDHPRHIEVQVLGDHAGNIIHLFERECSIQRRYQKIIEETPAVSIPDRTRKSIHRDAVAISRAMKYRNAGTIEFLVGGDRDYYFLEMNTRLQVEHPVTEMTTGIDLVEQQIRIASGESLQLNPEKLTQKGHAMECRIYAEDPAENFMPSPGRIVLYREPEGNNVRIDSGIRNAGNISSRYDPLIGKLIVMGRDRKETIRRMEQALSSMIIHGVRHNISFLRTLADHPAFRANNISTTFCEEHMDELLEKMNEARKKVDYRLGIFFFLTNRLLAGKKPHKGNIWNEIGFWRHLVEIPVSYNNSQILVRLSQQRNGFVFEIEKKKFEMKVFSAEEHDMVCGVGGKKFPVVVSGNDEGTGWVSYGGHTFEFHRMDLLQEDHVITETVSGSNFDDGIIYSPMPGRVVDVRVNQDERVRKGDILVVVESMKMENSLVAPFDGRIGTLHIRKDQMIGGREVLLEMIPEENNL